MLYIRKKVLAVSLGLSGAFTFPLLAQQQAQPQEQTQNEQVQPRIPVNLVDQVLNDFENAEDWVAFSTSPLKETKAQKRVQRGPIEDTYAPNNITDQEKSLFVPGQNHVLGIKGYIKDKGFDRIETKPPHAYIVRGIGRQLSVWVLSRNYKHILYAKLKDYTGKIYKVPFGKLDFFGWKKFTLTIPGWIPQSSRYSLFDKNLKFISIFVESNIHEPRGTYYFYLDQLTMKVDKTQLGYPGSQMLGPMVKNMTNKRLKMKVKFKSFKSKIYSSILGVLLSITLISGALNGRVIVEGQDIDSQEVRSVIVEGWETDVWQIEAIPGPPDGVASIKIVAGAPRNLSNNLKNKNSLGIKYNFAFPGHNSIVISPPQDRVIRKPTGQLDGNNQPIFLNIPGIELPGTINALSVWVLGRGNDGFLEAWVRDWRGDTHVLKMGSINFVGWKPLSVKVPTWIPQKANAFPQTRSMIFRRFVVRSDPNASTEEITLFLDSFKVLSNVHDLYFDGVEVSYDENDKVIIERLPNYTKELINKFSD